MGVMLRSAIVSATHDDISQTSADKHIFILIIFLPGVRRSWASFGKFQQTLLFSPVSKKEKERKKTFSIDRGNKEDEKYADTSNKQNNTQHKIHLHGARCLRKVLITG